MFLLKLNLHLFQNKDIKNKVFKMRSWWFPIHTSGGNMPFFKPEVNASLAFLAELISNSVKLSIYFSFFGLLLFYKFHLLFQKNYYLLIINILKALYIFLYMSNFKNNLFFLLFLLMMKELYLWVLLYY